MGTREQRVTVVDTRRLENMIPQLRWRVMESSCKRTFYWQFPFLVNLYSVLQPPLLLSFSHILCDCWKESSWIFYIFLTMCTCFKVLCYIFGCWFPPLTLKTDIVALLIFQFAPYLQVLIPQSTWENSKEAKKDFMCDLLRKPLN